MAQAPSVILLLLGGGAPSVEAVADLPVEQTAAAALVGDFPLEALAAALATADLPVEHLAGVLAGGDVPVEVLGRAAPVFDLVAFHPDVFQTAAIPVDGAVADLPVEHLLGLFAVADLPVESLRLLDLFAVVDLPVELLGRVAPVFDLVAFSPEVFRTQGIPLEQAVADAAVESLGLLEAVADVPVDWTLQAFGVLAPVFKGDVFDSAVFRTDLVALEVSADAPVEWLAQLAAVADLPVEWFRFDLVEASADLPVEWFNPAVRAPVFFAPVFDSEVFETGLNAVRAVADAPVEFPTVVAAGADLPVDWLAAAAPFEQATAISVLPPRRRPRKVRAPVEGLRVGLGPMSARLVVTVGAPADGAGARFGPVRGGLGWFDPAPSVAAEEDALLLVLAADA